MMNVHADKIIANEFIGKYNNCIDIGIIVPFASNKEIPNGFLLCNGASIRKDTYIDLFNIIGTTYGSVDEEHFNLPNLNGRFLEGNNISGTYKEAGLPNITGEIYPSASSPYELFLTDDMIETGAFDTRYGSSICANPTNITQQNIVGLDFNASRSNPIYGNSNTVQPNSLTIRYIIKAFNSISVSATELEVTQLANEITNKANYDLSNLNEQGRKAFFPSKSYVNIPANTLNYTAPANGYVIFIASSNTELDAISVFVNGITVLHYAWQASSSRGFGQIIPCAKNSVLTIQVVRGTPTVKGFTAFVYAEEEV